VDTRERVIFNSLCNVAGRGFSVLVALFLIPFMLGKLGPEAYAIIPLIMYSIVPFLEVFTSGVATSVGRYVTLHQARHETDEANRYFNTSFFILLGLCAVASVPIVALSYYFPEIFKVKPAWARSSQWTMLLAGVGFIITGVSSPFGAGMYFRQRFDLRSIFFAIGILARAGTIVLLFSVIGANTAYVALGMVVAATIQGVANLITGYRMLPGLKTSWRFFSREKLRDVSGFSFYLLISRVSLLLFAYTDYVLIVWLIGKEGVTVYSLGAQWWRLMRGFAITAVYALGPLATTLYATAQHDRIRSIFLKGSRVMVLLVCPVAVFLCVLAQPFMTAWVGGIEGIGPHAVRQAVRVLWVLVLPLVINLSVMPAFPMFTAMGRVRTVAFVTLAAAILNIAVSIWLAVGLGLGILGIALGSSICLLAKNTAFIPWYVCRICNARLKDFYRIFPRPVAACVPGVAFAILIQYFTNITNWPAIILVGMVCMASYFLIVYLWCLTDQEKAELSEIWSQFRKMLSRKKGAGGE